MTLATTRRNVTLVNRVHKLWLQHCKQESACLQQMHAQHQCELRFISKQEAAQERRANLLKQSQHGRCSASRASRTAQLAALERVKNTRTLRQALTVKLQAAEQRRMKSVAQRQANASRSC